MCYQTHSMPSAGRGGESCVLWQRLGGAYQHWQRLLQFSWPAVLPSSMPPQVLPGLLTERGSSHKTVVIAQSEVTSEETAVERKVRLCVLLHNRG